MKFVSLLSGGKDSVFATTECERHGHELVCAAHLAPQNNADELDSFCFQSAAHNVVEGVAACLGVPLIRRTWDGKSIDQSLNYSVTEGDEVEELYELLREVLRRHPDVCAVSSGAILSTYQRTRVETCCQRLRLTSLAYLWQRPQRQLLKDMSRSGLRAIVVKTATLGLEPEDLGLELMARETRSRFDDLHDKYNFHVCGEGGEYESLVLDSPSFSKRIVLTKTETLRLDDQPRGCGAVSLLKIVAWTLEDKTENQTEEVSDDSSDGDTVDDVAFTVEENVPVVLETEVRGVCAGRSCRCSRGDVGRKIVCVGGNLPSERGDAAAQLSNALEQCDTALTENGFDGLGDVFFAHLYLRDLGQFAAVNTVFEAAFSESRRVPSRSCVQVPLPNGVECILDVEATSSARSTLHVRSRSAWAPQCLGPYCQANTLIKGIAFAAGQVPLDAPTMTISTEGASLALRHAQQILTASGCSLKHALSIVAYTITGYDHRYVLRAAERYNLRPDAILCVKVPALPANAPCEIEAIAYKEPVHIWRDAAKEAGCVIYLRCCFIPRGFCASLVRVCAPRKGTEQKLDLAECLGALVAGAHLSLMKAGLREEHFCRLRVFIPEATSCAAVHALLEDLLEGEDVDPPAVTVVPVVSLEPGVALAAQVLGGDLGAAEADAWLKGGGGDSA